MVSERLEKIFARKVSRINDVTDRQIIFLYLCKKGSPKEIMDQFKHRKGEKEVQYKSRQSLYDIIKRYNHLGISPEYRRKMWVEDLEIQAKNPVLKHPDWIDKIRSLVGKK